MAERSEGGQPGNKNAEKWKEEDALKLANDLLKWLKESETNIFYEEFLCVENDYYKDLILYLESKFKSFSDLIKRAKSIQEMKLIKLGISDKVATTMSIFCLKNHHGYMDKKEVHNKGALPVTGVKIVKDDGDNK